MGSVALEESAWANSAGVENRSAGLLASAFRSACATEPGTEGRTRVTLGTSPVRRLAMSDCAVGAVYGGSPASISYSTVPRL